MNPNEDQFDIAGQPLIILTGPTAVGKTALFRCTGEKNRR